ncbi:uncharacterized protein TNCV_3436711 [Trichonephila clavipes]|nr:uncharacterized protein TNCV_3436711 [Trichonephila clavipes]
MIANYVNEQHDTWYQFLREFAYAIRTAVNETTGKTPAELFLGRKLITTFQKLVMVSDGTEFAVGDIEGLFDEARRNTKAKHEKWEKYYNRRMRDVQIKVNALTSKSEQDQATRLPDEKVINYGKIRKGKERAQESLYPWRSWFKPNESCPKCKIMATLLCDQCGVLLVDFMQQGTMINSGTYCATLLKFRGAFQNKRRGKLLKGVLLLHDDARHMSNNSGPNLIF